MANTFSSKGFSLSSSSLSSASPQMQRRSLDANPGRVAPGGPDGQHHYAASPSELQLIHDITSNASDQAMQNDDSSQLLLRKLGMKVSDLEYYKRRSLDANPRRVAPGGPDGQHHYAASPSVH
ncbi:proline-rich protein 2-like protein [Tanacetum coccineum]